MSTSTASMRWPESKQALLYIKKGLHLRDEAPFLLAVMRLCAYAFFSRI